MSNYKLPKMGLLRLSAQVADLLLISEGDVESVKEPRVRIAWHVLLFSTASVYFVEGTLGRFLSGSLQKSPELTLLWRCFFVISWACILGFLALLAYRHYRLLMLVRKDLRFKPIAFFFVAAVAYGGFLYRDLYILSPDLFRYSNPLVIPGPTAAPLSFPTSFLFSFDFFLYSACSAVSINYPRIVSGSAIVSFLNVAEVIATFLIVALLVATFVQNARPGNRTNT